MRRIGFMVAGVVLVVSAFAFAGGTKETPQASTASGSQPKTTLQMWHWAANKEPLYKTAIIPAFEKANPSITITTNVIPKESYWQVLTAAQIGGHPPALFMGNPLGDVLQQVKNDQVLDLTPYLDSKWRAALYPSTIQELTIDGKVMSMSMATNNAQVLYNVDRFSQLGIKAPITTMADMKRAVDSLRQHGYGGALYWAQTDDQGATLFIDWARQLYPKEFEAADRGDGKWDIPQFVDLMKQFDNYKSIWMNGVASLSLDQSVNLFTTGKASMYIIGNWAVQSILHSNPSFKIGVFPVPAIDSKTRPAALGSTAGTWMVSNHVSKAEQQAAVKFLRFFTMNEQGELVKTIGLCPAGPAGESALSEAPQLAQELCRAQNTAVPRDMFDSQVRNAIVSGIQGMLNGQASPAEVLRLAQQAKDQEKH